MKSNQPAGGEIIQTLAGSQPSTSTVSRIFHTLEEEMVAS